MRKPKTIVIGSGLAGLSAALELSRNGFEVLLLEAAPYIGGRTASWNKDGMEVESGLHRVLGFYTAFPKLVKKAGLKMKDIIIWEDEIEVKIATGTGKGPSYVYGASPVFKPFKTFSSPFRNRLLSWKETWKALKFFISGMITFITRPEKLDEFSVLDYANQFHLSEETVQRLLVPLTAGLFFIPPERYSAYVFFGPFVHALKRFYRVRIGAFRGGMTEVLAGPVVERITGLGGTVITEARVTRLLVVNNRVRGVQVNNETEYAADYVVLATSLGPAHQIIRASSLQDSFPDLLSLPSMPEVNLQIESSRPLWPIDRTVFGVGASLVTFTEQSRTTFTDKAGRLSIILSPPDKIIGLKDEEIFEIFKRDAPRLGIDSAHVTNYRVIRHPADFYLLSPNMNKLRPQPRTLIGGLFLAGDYVQQSFMATMEGAVIAGNNAAREVINAEKSV
ncbi:MAG TPA: FAD-dependent oxidoreductase [Nitrosospira sp.]|nr:FAD-dependent oxidoreductase [Nitrosospira sp.]